MSNNYDDAVIRESALIIILLSQKSLVVIKDVIVETNKPNKQTYNQGVIYIICLHQHTKPVQCQR